MYNRILEHLKKHKYITSFEAFKNYGVTRLSHYIWLLRQRGFKIENEMVSGVNRYGTRTHYVKYWLVEEQENG